MTKPICGICRDRNPKFETRCGHHFHRECILEWLGKQKTCPYCRTKISSSKKLEYTLRHYDGNEDKLNTMKIKNLIKLISYYCKSKKDNFEGIIGALMKIGWKFDSILPNYRGNLFGMACDKNHIAMAEYLIKLGADVNQSLVSSKNIPINYAAKNGSLELLNLLIEHGADLNARESKGRTALMFACGYGRTVIVERLLQFDIDVNQCCSDKLTPLHYISDEYEEVNESDRVTIAKMLLAKGADIHAITATLSTPLCNAAEAGFIGLVDLYIEHGADVNTTRIGKMSPILGASMRGYTEIVKKLIECGANIHKYAFHKFTPLHFACLMGKLDTAKLLIENGCDVKSLSKSRETPLHLALNEASFELISFLLEKGADIDARTFNEKETPLLKAIRRNYSDTAIFLINLKANVNIRNNWGKTALQLALDQSQYEVAFSLMDNGCEINTKDKFRATPLHSLCSSASRKNSNLHNKLLSKLLKAGCDINAKGGILSAPPLFYICQHDPSLTFVSTLVKYGADINAKSSKGMTALHQAVFKCNVKLVKKLLSLGADVNAQDFLGRKPLHYLLIGMRKLPYIFEYIKIYKIMEMLISAGADINAQTHRGATAFHYIRRDRELNILKKFIEMGADIFKADNKGRDLEFRLNKRRVYRILIWLRRSSEYWERR